MNFLVENIFYLEINRYPKIRRDWSGQIFYFIFLSFFVFHSFNFNFLSDKILYFLIYFLSNSHAHIIAGHCKTFNFLRFIPTIVMCVQKSTDHDPYFELELKMAEVLATFSNHSHSQEFLMSRKLVSEASNFFLGEIFLRLDRYLHSRKNNSSELLNSSPLTSG